MSPQTRSLLVIGFFALMGVGALAFIAGRYNAILERRSGTAPVTQTDALGSNPSTRRPEAGALATVDRFIDTRRRIKQALPPLEPGALASAPDAASARLKVARERAVSEVGWSLEDYAALREVYRDWRGQRAGVMGPIVAAFELRIERLLEVELGPYEALDI
jgi:hypothetical protein